MEEERKFEGRAQTSFEIAQKKSKCNLHCMQQLLTRHRHLIRMQRQLNALSWHFQAFLRCPFSMLEAASKQMVVREKIYNFFILLNNRTDHEYVIFSFFLYNKLSHCVLRMNGEHKKKSKLFPTVGKQKKCTKLRRWRTISVVRESQWVAGNIVSKVNKALKT